MQLQLTLSMQVLAHAQCVLERTVSLFCFDWSVLATFCPFFRLALGMEIQIRLALWSRQKYLNYYY